MRPRLKELAWERSVDKLTLVHDPRDLLVLADPDGVVEKLLLLLREGGRTITELSDELGLPIVDTTDTLKALDERRLLENGDHLGGMSGTAAERHSGNLAFFESFGTLERSREDLQQQLSEAHVLVLGTGGPNAHTIPHLCGLGVRKLTLLDRDTVEARHFSGQYLYRWSDIGARKVERAADWARAFDPDMDVATIDSGVEGAGQLAEILADTRPDLVASGIDQPREADLWVNEACVRHNVPYVRGGMGVTQGIVWSVAPGISACRACIPHDPSDPGHHTGPDEPAAARLRDVRPGTHRGIGPVAGLLGSFGAFEIARHLTAFEPPAYAGRPLTIDFAAGCATTLTEWPRDPDCTVCGGK
ncbi:hypothetical protein E1295_11030 [Nonomuraea mesophila]|uniref:THIF-type NAD/FAD binding fold domain-containing protein n=1 Tax=Nonomuraea mesophila TaxID=2530382 RepID=A0A4R5FTB6_9ACTN|nr:ThiF family adenylyltransferase [Nonomuraea mesophila]TDE56289.1 hypothetical protein E1295_11030 [Nonomuraea mesophila]